MAKKTKASTEEVEMSQLAFDIIDVGGKFKLYAISYNPDTLETLVVDVKNVTDKHLAKVFLMKKAALKDILKLGGV